MLFKNGAVYQYRSEDNKLKSAIIFRLGEERINDITKILFYFEVIGQLLCEWSFEKNTK